MSTIRVLFLLAILPAVTAGGQARSDAKATQAKVAALLKAGGHGYTKPGGPLDAATWNTPFRGVNRNPIWVGILANSDTVVLSGLVGDRKDFPHSADLFAQFLEFNHQWDSAKLVFTPDQVMLIPICWLYVSGTYMKRLGGRRTTGTMSDLEGGGWIILTAPSA